mmetsp:Transcript_88624/g.228574  ORF Transcript_88624/g.228574 Transcript_88624/m.228574 type:complete len:687 (-) Transcript_88624:51-2111(-)|eukprot:CAMPEP_0195060990 /NCGR_PEP_ID=MMETSP0448-20130528/8117_1 /TAXON_ID=66468 /ORGANISM="Heterocapsa triquestra, Strain CCMP 448" /LENGTH=686 /DNA_ID=CAMNT_0040091511 /DNA_START=60 /DNA_END=2120 /DNA_ORIENTATION=-
MPAMGRRRVGRRRSAACCIGLVGAAAAWASLALVKEGVRDPRAVFVSPWTAATRPGAEAAGRTAVTLAAKGGGVPGPDTKVKLEDPPVAQPANVKLEDPPAAQPANGKPASATQGAAVAAEAKEERAFLGSLWEQWGLLGLAVGLFVAFGGASLLGVDLDLDVGEALLTAAGTLAPGLMKEGVEGVADAGVDTSAGVGLTEALSAFGASVARGLAGGLMSLNPEAQGDLAKEGMEGIAGAAATLAGAEALATGAAQDAAELAELSGSLGAELELGVDGLLAEEASVAGAAGSFTAGKVALASAIGTASSFAGLVVEGVTKPPPMKGGSKAFLDSSGVTPGTIRQSRPRRRRASGEPAPVDEDRPAGAWQLGQQNFQREWRQLLKAAKRGNTVPRRLVPKFVPMLQLSNEAVEERERARAGTGEDVPTPAPVRIVYDVLCKFIDVVFEDRPIQRFWFLETVARMPYFAYSSCLHLYETLGWWRSPELRAVHAAEEDNELHHLLIMESLGGDQRWLDRFFAQHGAIAYYWILIGFFFIDPRWSYNFSRLIEAHAVDTYGEFRDANEELLKSLPPPPVAVEYYRAGDFYLFDKFQTALSAMGKIRRPPCSTLYDVFSNICDDEEQHVLTMEACEAWVAGGEPAVPLGFNLLSVEDYEKEVTRTDEGRAAWIAWGEEVAEAARKVGGGLD